MRSFDLEYAGRLANIFSSRIWTHLPNRKKAPWPGQVAARRPRQKGQLRPRVGWEVVSFVHEVKFAQKFRICVKPCVQYNKKIDKLW